LWLPARPHLKPAFVGPMQLQADPAHCALSRRSLVALPILGLPGLARSTPSGGVNFDLQRTFFQGAYFDAAAAPNSHLARYLVRPLLTDAERRQRADRLTGSELTRSVRPILAQDTRLRGLLRMSLDGDRGNPVALYVSRAQHDTFRLQLGQNDPPIFITVISIALSLDIFTDQAAWEQSRRFQSLFSHLLVMDNNVRSPSPPSDSELEHHYAKTLQEALSRLAARIEPQLRWERVRAEAAFRVQRFNLPREPSAALQNVLSPGTAMPAAGGVDVSREAAAVQRELLHLVNQAVVEELNRRNVGNIVMLPPPSTWADSRILNLLRTRPGVSSDISILSEIDPAAVNGYEIVAAAVRDTETLVESRSYGSSKVYGVQLAARIMRPSQGGGRHVPSSIADPMAKTALGIGSQAFVEAMGSQRGARREVVLDAFRAGAADLAKTLVPLMVRTAQEFNG
jgi:hypothetical protein